MRLDLFRSVVPFVAVIEERSFRKAAARLGVSPAAITKAVQALETDVGLALVTRSARSVQATPEGEEYFRRCQQAVAAVSGGRLALEGSRHVPQGEIAVSAPFVVTSLLAPALTLLRARHPRLTLRVSVTDRLSRIAEEAIDVAVRVGPLSDSTLVSRLLRKTRLVTVASPSYLARRPAPRTVEDLERHDCLVLQAPTGRLHAWRFANGARDVAPSMRIDHGPALVECALSGLGVAQAFDFMVEASVREGRLVQLLRDHVADGPDVHAVRAPGRRVAARVHAAFEAFADAFAAVRPASIHL